MPNTIHWVTFEHTKGSDVCHQCRRPDVKGAEMVNGGAPYDDREWLMPASVADRVSYIVGRVVMNRGCRYGEPEDHSWVPLEAGPALWSCWDEVKSTPGNRVRSSVQSLLMDVFGALDDEVLMRAANREIEFCVCTDDASNEMVPMMG